MDKKTIKFILIASFCMFIGVFELKSVPIVLPQLSVIFQMESYLINFVSINYLLFCVAFGLIIGKIISKFGIIKVAKILSIIMILFALISTMILNPYTLIIARSIQGVCCAGFFFLTYIIISKCIKKEYLTLSMAITGSTFFLAMILGSVIGGFLAYNLYPQYVFSVTIPIIFICLILLFSIKEDWKDEEIKIDYIGSLIWFVAIILLIYGITFLNEFIGLVCFLLSFIFIAIFIIYELRIDYPLYNFKLLKNKVYFKDNYSAMMGAFIFDGFFFVFPLYFQYVGLLNSSQTGLIMGFFGIILLIFTLISGKLSEKYNIRKLIIIGTLIMIISSLLLIFFEFITFKVFLFLAIILLLGFIIFDIPNKIVIFKSFDEEYLSDVSVFFSAIRDIGSLLSMAVYTLFLSVFSFFKLENLEYTFIGMIILFFLIALSILILNLKNLKVSNK